MKDRPCTEDDFKSVNREPSAYGFYTMDGSTEDIVNKSGYDLRCIDEEFNVRGDFNTNSAENLMITFELCDSTKRTCKAKSVIEEALDFSYILLIENQKTYKHQYPPTTHKMIQEQT